MLGAMLTGEGPDGFAALAPMAGFTDRVMRSLCLRQGAALAMTEVVNSAGLTHDSRRTWHLLETMPNEHPVGAHFYGNDPDVMAEAARRIADLGRFAFIDINAGCPVRKIVAKGCGAAMMDDPVRLGRIVSAIRSAVDLPVTVKTRIGLEPDRGAIALTARAAEDAGAAAIFVHGRFARDKHAGAADWDAIARVATQCRIPVWGNGGVKTADDVLRLRKQSGVAGVLIGRAAIGNPWIFADVRRMLKGESPRAPAPAVLRETLEVHMRGLAELKALERRYRRAGSQAAETAAVMQFRPHLLRYLVGIPGGRDIRLKLNAFQTISDVLDAVDSLFDPARLR